MRASKQRKMDRKRLNQKRKDLIRDRKRARKAGLSLAEYRKNTKRR